MPDIRDWSTTPADNATAGSINWAEGQPPSTVNDSARQMMADARGQWNDGGWFVWGDTHTYASATATTTTGDQRTTYVVNRRARAVGTTTGTIYGTISAVTYSANTAITYTWDSGSLTNETLTVAVGYIDPTGDPIDVSAISNLSSFSLSASVVTTYNMAASTITSPENFGFTATVGSSALTIAVKTQAGTDPSATDVVKIPFQDQSGGYSVLSLTSATSLVVSSGSTLGTTNGVLYRLWIVGFNDSGTFRLGIVNTQVSSGVFPLMPDLSNSATAEGGAGAADSAGVIYAGAAVTDMPMVILGYIESTQATAGTWATTPSKAIIWQKGMKVPGDTVQIHNSIKTDTETMASSTFADITGLSVTFTPSSAANRVLVRFKADGSSTGSGNNISFRIMRGATPIGVGAAASNRLQVSSVIRNATNDGMFTCMSEVFDSPATASSTTYNVEWQTNTGTATLNRSGTDTDNANYQRSVTVLTAMEIMA